MNDQIATSELRRLLMRQAQQLAGLMPEADQVLTAQQRQALVVDGIRRLAAMHAELQQQVGLEIGRDLIANDPAIRKLADIDAGRAEVPDTGIMQRLGLARKDGEGAPTP